MEKSIISSLSKKIIITLFCILVLSSCIIQVSATHDLINEEASSINDSLHVVSNDKIINIEDRYIVPSNTSLIIKEKDIEIILPKGSDIISYKNNEIEVVHTDFEIEKINLSESNKLSIPFNYGLLKTGTKTFTFKIYFDRNYSEIHFKKYLNNYSIHWGDNQITTGSTEIPTILIHNYTKQGVYNITIDIIDDDGVQYTFIENYTINLSTAEFITFWTVENKEPLTIGAYGMIGFFIFFGMALTETGKYRILALLTLAFPMITHSNDEDILDQFVRGQIYGFIKTNPGAHYNQIMRELEIKNGTLSYHLYVLEKSGIIKSRIEQFRYRAFYPTEMKFPEEERYRLTDLQIRILETIKSNKGTNQNYIAETLKETHQTISYNIKILEQAELIYVYRKGRKNQIYLSDNPQPIQPLNHNEKKYSINIK